MKESVVLHIKAFILVDVY